MTKRRSEQGTIGGFEEESRGFLGHSILERFQIFIPKRSNFEVNDRSEQGTTSRFFDEKSRGFLSHYFEFDHRQEARNLEVFLPKSILLEVEEDPLEWFWAI